MKRRSDITTQGKTRGNATILWFHHDLRLTDNPALTAACRRGRPVIPIFIWSPQEETPWQPGAATRWWLHQSLQRLAESLCNKGSHLIIRTGPTQTVLADIIRETGASSVYWNRRYEPAIVQRDRSVAANLAAQGISIKTFNANLLLQPEEVLNRAGKPFLVFTPLYRTRYLSLKLPLPLEIPPQIPPPETWPVSKPLKTLKLEPPIDWAAGMRTCWQPGENGAQILLNTFLTNDLAPYSTMHDRPDFPGTSRLSPHLRFGEISPRTIWHTVRNQAAVDGRTGVYSGQEAFLRQLVWREFSYHLLHHFPHTTEQPLKTEYTAFPWRDDDHAWHAWCKGRTGYPFVDAGMRQLWTTGWMHNRARMVAASFLVKHLLIPWQQGARWFWDTLVDADLANNTMGWQWVAGSGADAVPYFRIFNPVLQGHKFDPHNHYVRQWIPELATIEDRWLQEPWKSCSPTTYPTPIVDHTTARRDALTAFTWFKRHGHTSKR